MKFVDVLAVFLSTQATEAPPSANWGLDKMEVECAQVKSEGRGIRVAVIDTGVDAKHTSLKGKVGNGWNLVSKNDNVTDFHGHGTHVSSIIAAVAPKATIIPVKYYSEHLSGGAAVAKTIEAIDYAVAQHVDIINFSAGGPEASAKEFEALRRAEMAGIIVVTAAGNDGLNSDLSFNLYYPGAYGLSNMIVVASTTHEDKLAKTSNWGAVHVDVAAPGEKILGAAPNHRTSVASGTSQATAFVTGLAALVKSQNPFLSPQQVKKIILDSADPVESLRGKVASGKRVNACAAVSSVSK